MQLQQTCPTTNPPPFIHEGEVRNLGEYGPKYQVGRILQQLDGDARVEITFIESGETTDYPLSGVLKDPLAD